MLRKKTRLAAPAFRLAALAAVSLCLASPAADADPGRNLAATCANCHGTHGEAVPGAGIAPLAGVPRQQLLQKLTDFKAGIRPATVMHQIAKGYSDEQLELIAAWFEARGRIAPTAAPQPGTPLENRMDTGSTRHAPGREGNREEAGQ